MGLFSTEQYLNFLFTSLSLLNKMYIRGGSALTLGEANEIGTKLTGQCRLCKQLV